MDYQNFEFICRELGIDISEVDKDNFRKNISPNEKVLFKMVEEIYNRLDRLTNIIKYDLKVRDW